jgi:mannan endo-1,4-beta-mannosidase
MSKNLTSAILLAACILAVSCAEKPPVPSGIAETLSASATAGTPLYGHQDDLMYGHTWNANDDPGTDLTRSDVKDVCGHYPAILGLDMGGIELGDTRNLDGNDFSLMREAATAHYARGGIVSLSWHLRNPLTGGDSWDVSSNQAVASVLPGGEKHELFVQWLDRLADWILSLKAEDGSQIPVIWRPWHEHSGSWFWWGRDLCTPEEYNALWRMTYDHLVHKRGIEGLVWAISPNFTEPDFEGWEARYPGDDVVDIVGLDCYSWGQRDNFIRQIRAGLTSLQRFCERHGKILAVTETGLEGISDAQWWTGALSPALHGFPVSYVLTWRNASDKPTHFYAPYAGQDSAEDFAAWIRQDKITVL